MTEGKDIAGSGHPKARAQEAQNVHPSTMTNIERERRAPQTVHGFLQQQKSATGQEQALQDETIDLQERELPDRQTL